LHPAKNSYRRIAIALYVIESGCNLSKYENLNYIWSDLM